MVLVELFADDDFLKGKLIKLITMTSSYIERRENELKHRIKVAEQEVKAAEQEVKAAEQEVKVAKQDANVAIEEASIAKELLMEIAEDDDVKLNDALMKKILLVTSKM